MAALLKPARDAALFLTPYKGTNGPKVKTSYSLFPNANMMKNMHELAARFMYVHPGDPAVIGHGIGHSRRILKLLRQVDEYNLFPELKITVTELMLVELAALTHDWGMGFWKVEDKHKFALPNIPQWDEWMQRRSRILDFLELDPEQLDDYQLHQDYSIQLLYAMKNARMHALTWDVLEDLSVVIRAHRSKAALPKPDEVGATGARLLIPSLLFRFLDGADLSKKRSRKAGEVDWLGRIHDYQRLMSESSARFYASTLTINNVKFSLDGTLEIISKGKPQNNFFASKFLGGEYATFAQHWRHLGLRVVHVRP